MATNLTQRYGKHRVRVSKVRRPRVAAPQKETHEFIEVSVDVELEGKFDAAYLEGDNRSVIATDTCKNTVYALAKDDPLDSIESFGLTHCPILHFGVRTRYQMPHHASRTVVESASGITACFRR